MEGTSIFFSLKLSLIKSKFNDILSQFLRSIFIWLKFAISGEISQFIFLIDDKIFIKVLGIRIQLMVDLNELIFFLDKSGSIGFFDNEQTIRDEVQQLELYTLSRVHIIQLVFAYLVNNNLKILLVGIIITEGQSRKQILSLIQYCTKVYIDLFVKLPNFILILFLL